MGLEKGQWFRAYRAAERLYTESTTKETIGNILLRPNLEEMGRQRLGQAPHPRSQCRSIL